jgi:hypothetical protein
MYSTNMKVQHALKLWSFGAITLQIVKNARASKGKKQIALPKAWVLNDGMKESTLFNDTTWDTITRMCMDFINNQLHESSLAKVILRAKEFIGPSYQDTAEAVEDEDIQMVDLSDNECMWISLSFIPLVYSDLTSIVQNQSSHLQ